MITTTLFPMFLGVMHCFEADHVLAVASVSSKSTKPRALFYQGVTWGVGHSIPIVIIGVLYMLTSMFVLEGLPFSLEIIVGIVLIIAGVIRLFRKTEKEQLNNHIKALLFVGVLHGIAGSAGIVLAHTTHGTSLFTQCLYLLGFSIGSIMGMGLISLFIGKLEGVINYVKKMQWLIPVLSIGYGIFMIYKFI